MIDLNYMNDRYLTRTCDFGDYRTFDIFILENKKHELQLKMNNNSKIKNILKMSETNKKKKIIGKQKTLPRW